MPNHNPHYFVRVTTMREPIGGYAYIVKNCPRCDKNIGINKGMLLGVESIICKGRFPDGRICNGHFYLRNGNDLEFVGTVKAA